VAEAFPGYKTIPVPVSGPLHLKTLIGLCGEDTFCVATESNDSIKMFERIRDLSDIPYKAIYVPEDNVANTIFINGRVICKSRKENPKSYEILKKFCEHELIEVESSEIEKAVGSLTCMSLRFNRPVSIRPAEVDNSVPPVEILQPGTAFNAVNEQQRNQQNIQQQTKLINERLRTMTTNSSAAGSDDER